MKLFEAVAQYVAHKQSMGMRFETEQRTLKSFCRSLGDTEIAVVGPTKVYAFLAGNGEVTAFWRLKQRVLRGFYDFAIAHRYVTQSPLPRTAPKPSRQFVPYIFTQAELRQLLDAVASCQVSRMYLEPCTCRTLLLLLYGAGLRISEALSLTRADVDLDVGVLQIRETKFYKTRLVPVGADLREVLTRYASRPRGGNRAVDAPFFVSRTGKAVTRALAEDTFRRLRCRANVLRRDGSSYQPRLQDMRHSFAVHRLISWYRDEANVQRLLPQLATYLGHVHIAATQHYLTLTPELLKVASQRFEHYAMGEPS